jgi:hypothetical protein
MTVTIDLPYTDSNSPNGTYAPFYSGPNNTPTTQCPYKLIPRDTGILLYVNVSYGTLARLQFAYFICCTNSKRYAGTVAFYNVTLTVNNNTSPSLTKYYSTNGSNYVHDLWLNISVSRIMGLAHIPHDFGAFCISQQCTITRFYAIYRVYPPTMRSI